jgi:hypothetical protein
MFKVKLLWMVVVVVPSKIDPIHCESGIVPVFCSRRAPERPSGAEVARRLAPNSTINSDFTKIDQIPDSENIPEIMKYRR